MTSAILYPRGWVGPDGRIFGLAYDKMYKIDPNGIGTRYNFGSIND